MTDVGAVFEKTFQVIPCEDGSFIVANEDHSLHWGFSTVDDLLKWMVEQARPLRVVKAVKVAAGQ